MRCGPRTVFILLLVVVMVVAATTFRAKGGKEAYGEYPFIAARKEAPDQSCMKLVAERGWINPNDQSPEAKKRISVISDMEVARVQQNLLSAAAYPSIDACTLGMDVIGMYYNANGRNVLDPNTCVMEGKTVEGDVVRHELKAVNVESPYQPKGCMVDLNTTDRDSFLGFVDNAYKLKMYPDLKVKRDYEQTMVKLSDDNAKLTQRADTAEALLSKAEAAKALAELESERIVRGACRDAYTEWNDAGGWAYNFLDRHNVECGPNEVLTRFRLQSSYGPDKTRYKYRCCAVDTSPLPQRVKQNVDSTGTAFQDSMLWNMMGLAQHDVACKDGGMLKRFQLESQYISNTKANAKYNGSCAKLEPQGLEGRKIEGRCRKVQTPGNASGTTFNMLDRHEVACEDGEGVGHFALKSNGNSVFYDYTCCKPELVKA